MTEKYFVICGNRQEFQDFIVKKSADLWLLGHTSISMSNFVYVDDVMKLKGIQNPHGWFYGTWCDHTNLGEIIQQLCISSTTYNDSLRNIKLQAEEYRKSRNELL